MKLASGLVIVGFACSAVLATEPEPRTLSVEDRVKAQAAIERVYYSHQIGATTPFEVEVPRAVLESKVHRYMDQTAALTAYWRTSVTGQMLERELVRMAQGTRMPERLHELFAALGNDTFVIQECLVRPALVDRLTRNFYAFDPKFHAATRARAESLRRQFATGELSPTDDRPNRTLSHLVVGATEAARSMPHQPFQQRMTEDEFQRRRAELPAGVGQVSALRESAEGFSFSVVLSETTADLCVASYVVPKTSWDTWWSAVNLGEQGDAVTAVASGTAKLPVLTARASQCTADDTWDNGSLVESHVTDPRQLHTTVWTGTLMVVWGGFDAGLDKLNSGGRYDPAIDSWTPMSTLGAPSARTYHTAVWTGSRMVVWGGQDSSNTYLNTGGRYNPTTDSWTTTSVVGAPTARIYHTAVWTGSFMVVWGGYDVNGGGRYNPVTDSWIPITVSGAPTGRYWHSAVWTGSLMVIWGSANLANNSGGRYDPVADTWTPVSMSGAPSARYHHSAVWTGNRMIVWGGTTATNPVEVLTNTGGRYDPSTDTWTSMSTANAPRARAGHGAIWTGNRMVVWGGYYSDIGNIFINDGGRYDPASNLWTPMSTAGAPTARAYQTPIWTGGLMVVWGGVNNNSAVAGGGRYDPSTDTWTPVSTLGQPSFRVFHTAIWTGSLMVVWGGFDGYNPGLDTGGRYDPAVDAWTPTSVTGAPSARHDHTAVWTGNRMVVWGGYANELGYVNTGGRYDAVADVWTPTSTIGAPLGRQYHTSVWTGHLMIVWGGMGEGDPDTGGRYDPVADSWTPTSLIGAPTGRYFHTAVWTGHDMVVWGGQVDTFGFLGTGGRYDPLSDVWTPTSMTSAPTPRTNHTAVWTGQVMLVWGGEVSNYNPVNNGKSYDPVTDAWTPISTVAAPPSRWSHSAVWTKDVMIVWGGFESGTNLSNAGGRYDPVTDAWLPTSVSNSPSARTDHTAVWTGTLMVVWGGQIEGGYASSGGRYALGSSVDDDGDGYTECQRDCNDDDPAIYPGAPQMCDGKNNDCDDPSWPMVPSNEVDADHDGFGMCQGECADNDATVYPGAPQLCDGRNNDCSDVSWPTVPADEADVDLDGYRICGGDCDDASASVHSGATESCNGVDDNCDGVIDNGGNALCDDATPCTDDRCDGAAGCAHPNNTSPCDDGNACTMGDHCLSGLCLTGDGSPVCDDGNVCTSDSCNPSTGCVFANNTIACDDGSACTVGDTCAGGACHGTAIVCNDNIPCTDDSCIPATGVCVFTNDDTNTCSDGNLCTQADACVAGSCSGSNPVPCSGGCPPGFIQVGGLCQKTYDIGVGLLDNLNAFCDGTGTNRYNNCGRLNYGFHWTDLGGGLTVSRVDVQLESGIRCNAASSTVRLNGTPAGSFNRVGVCNCVSSHGAISLSGLPVAAYVRAGVNAISISPSGDCEGLSKSVNLGNNFARVTVTYAPPSSACQVGTCDPATGGCNFSDLADGTACSDDNACTEGDSCGGGECLPGSPTVCNDSNPCTDDSCNPAAGCVFTNNTTACADSDPCTVGDTCAGGTCQSGSPAPPPPEVQDVTVGADKASFSWPAVTGAQRYDVVRGSTSAFPVGPGGGPEVCFDNLAGTTLVDPTFPDPGTGSWYLARGESACGIGTFGNQRDGSPRSTTTCP